MVSLKHALEGFFESLRQEEPDIHILQVRPSWIGGTGIRANRIGGGGEKADGGLDARRCARAVVKAMKRRRQTLTLPAHYRWLPLLSELFPNALRRAVGRKVRAQTAQK